jgi:hypothetical protein
MIGTGDSFYIFIREFPVGTVYHMPHFARINKQYFSSPVSVPSGCFVLGDKPEADRDLSGVKQLAWQSNDTVHIIFFHKLLSDLSLTCD